MPLDTPQIDRLIRAAFHDKEQDDIFSNGLCQSFAAGLAAHLAEVDPGLKTELRAAEHEGAFDHAVLYVPRLDETFDWEGAQAQERWSEHRGGTVDWRDLPAVDSPIEGSGFSDRMAGSVRARLQQKAALMQLPDVARMTTSTAPSISPSRGPGLVR